MGTKKVRDLNKQVIATERAARNMRGEAKYKAERKIGRLKTQLIEEKAMLTPDELLSLEREMNAYELGLQSKEAFSDTTLGDIFSSGDIDDQANHLMEEVAKPNDDMLDEEEEFDLHSNFTTFDDVQESLEDAIDIQVEQLEEEIRRLEDACDLLDEVPDLDMTDVPPDVQADMLINAQLIAESNNAAKIVLGAEIARSYAEVYKHNHTNTSTNENTFFAQIKEMLKQGAEKLIDTCKFKLDDIKSKLRDNNAPDEPKPEDDHNVKPQQ